MDDDIQQFEKPLKRAFIEAIREEKEGSLVICSIWKGSLSLLVKMTKDEISKSFESARATNLGYRKKNDKGIFKLPFYSSFRNVPLSGHCSFLAAKQNFTIVAARRLY